MEKTISLDVQAQDAKFSGTLALISSWMIYEQGSYTVSHHWPEQPRDSKVRKYQPRLCKILEASLWSWWNVQILSDLPGRDGHCSLHPDHSWPSWSMKWLQWPGSQGSQGTPARICLAYKRVGVCPLRRSLLTMDLTEIGIWLGPGSITLPIKCHQLSSLTYCQAHVRPSVRWKLDACWKYHEDSEEIQHPEGP